MQYFLHYFFLHFFYINFYINFDINVVSKFVFKSQNVSDLYYLEILYWDSVVLLNTIYILFSLEFRKESGFFILEDVSSRFKLRY